MYSHTLRELVAFVQTSGHVELPDGVTVTAVLVPGHVNDCPIRPLTGLHLLWALLTSKAASLPTFFTTVVSSGARSTPYPMGYEITRPITIS